MKTRTPFLAAALLALPMPTQAQDSQELEFSAISAEATDTDGAPARDTEDGRTVLAEVPRVDVESQLPLSDAILLALRNNLDIELARTAPEIAEQAIEQAEGAFDPIGQARYIFNHGELPVTSPLQAGNSGDSQVLDNWDYGASISGVLPFGLQYSSGTSVGRLETDQNFQLLDRRFESSFDNQLTLPLMRDFRTNQASVTVDRTVMAREMSEEEFRSQLSTIVAGVEDLYWALSAARAGVNVAQKSLMTAQDLLEQTQVQEEVGVVSRVAVTQAEAGVAERELNLIRAENTAQAAHDALLDAILAPTASVFEDRELIPQAPRFREYPFDLDVAIRRALKNRPELAMSKTAIEMAELETELAENQAKPRLDLVGSYTLRGQAGRFRDNFIPVPNPNDDPLDPDDDTILVAAPDNTPARDSFDDFFRGDGNRSYSIGFRVEVPFMNRTGKATEVQRRIEERQARTRMRRQEQAVIREVRDAARGIETASKSVRAAERRRVASAESLRAEQERLRLGDSTPFQVLEFDADLSEAEGTLIEALRSYENAITALERVQGTLLETRNIRIKEELNR